MKRIVAKMPIGRLIQKTHGQPTVVVMIPPTAGPMIAVPPQTAENRPWTLARCDGRVDVADDREGDGLQRSGTQPLDGPEDNQLVIDLHKPQATDATTNTISPKRKIGLRPYMSASLLKSGTVTVAASR